MNKIINSLLQNTNLLESLNTSNTSCVRSDFTVNKDSLFEITYVAFLAQIAREKYQVQFLQEVLKNALFKVFLTENKKYLIVSFLNKEFIYFRVVFNVKPCTFIYWLLIK